ncbi:hypothetical protein ACFUN8_30480 [Streptomyces sp. NPDC057307]|uniref:hypothetical protein n=1 Tax=Streptomyces sp. NPDC057307 TaxID=3346096 RepID=UPI00363889C0
MPQESCGYISLELEGDPLRGHFPYWRAITSSGKNAGRLSSLLEGERASFCTVVDRSVVHEISSKVPAIFVTSIGAARMPLSFRLAGAGSLGLFALQVESSNLRTVLERDFAEVASLDRAESIVFRLEIGRVSFTTLTGRTMLFFRPTLNRVSV